MNSRSSSGVSHSLICRSVRIAPGTTELTRMLWMPSSRASERVKPLIAALAVVYATIPGVPRIHDTEPMLMIAPPPCFAMAGATLCAAKK